MKIFVGFTPMTDLNHRHDLRAIGNLIDHAEVSCPYAPRIMATQFEAAWGPRLLTESIHFCFHGFVMGRVQSRELFF